MRVCITGASGKIGSSFVSRLAAKTNIKVRALTRRTAGLVRGSISANPAVEWQEGDLASPASCERLIADQDVIVHLAHTNAPLTADQHLVSDAQLNLTPTLNLLEAIRRSTRRPHLVFASSGGAVYAPSERHEPFDETAPCRPKGAYGIQKLAAEHYIELLGERGHLTACILRISTAYGWLIPPTHQQGFVGVALYQALREEPIRILGDPDNVRDYLFIDDLCDALTRALELRTGTEIFNIGSGRGTSVREMVRTIERSLGSSVRCVEEACESARYLPDWSVLNVDKARRMLGWSASVSLDQGLRLTVQRARLGVASGPTSPRSVA